MRAVMAGQAPAQRVKMKSATQGWPRRSASVTGRPDRSVRKKAGSAP